ncbi:uncharacterized protein LOC114262383 [Camellia sinensis]|uniref:uncharacterized protein LOC114262383 n=1 Tax=Camellia sinensis TaxID=4442 RepID=UPI0010366665|nr:uncharacterized protein LOC114262383 [Camellia sinensis]
MTFGQSGKLLPRFINPYDIIERIGEVAYRLALPQQLSGVHDGFHVSMLRKYESDPSHVLDWTEIEGDEDVSYEEKPIQILDTTEQVLRGKTISLVKVLWHLHGIEKDTLKREVKLFPNQKKAFASPFSPAKAIQQAHSFSMQSFETRMALADKTRDFTGLQKTNKSLQ